MSLSSQWATETTSMSPSASRSPAKTEREPKDVVEITRRVHDGGDAPSFSYHAIVLSDDEDDRTSTSASPSRSAAESLGGVTAASDTLCWVQRGGEAPACSNQAIRSCAVPAVRMSRSPSRSTS